MDDILTVKEVAQLLKMNERTVLKMAQTGAIPAAKIRSQWRFKRELVDRWLEDKMLGQRRDLARATASTATMWTPLPEVLDNRLVKLDLTASTKKEALAQLVQLLVDVERLKRADGFLRKLLEREQLMTTALGDGVAFPHPREPQPDLFDPAKVVTGISPRGVDYDALDGKPVHVFFLICASDDSTHLRVMAQLTRIIRGRDVVGKLLRAKSNDEVIELFAQWDRESAPGTGSQRVLTGSEEIEK